MDIVKAARKQIYLAIEKYGPPYHELFTIAETKALQLADKLAVDKKIIQVGMYFLDIKLGESIQAGVMEQHVERGVKETRNFLNDFDLSITDKEKIINCVEAHHGHVPYICKEAEICANADCYKFLTPRGIFFYLTVWGKRNVSFEETLGLLEQKIEEKHNILSLEICQQELEEYYQTFKRYIKEARSL